MRAFLVRMGRLDRRWIYATIALAVILPLVFHLVFPAQTSPIVQRIFDKVDGLPPGSRVVVSADFGPSTVPENQPMLEVVVRHALEKKLRVYMLTLWATGPPMLKTTIANVVSRDFPDRIEGTDWVNLGYKAGNQGVINQLTSDFKTTFPVDAKGRDVRTIPMMREVRTLSDMDLIICIGSGLPGVKEWVQFGGDPSQVPVAGGVTAVEAPLLYPYYPKQLLGLMGGLQGAAEYEAALVKAYPQYRDRSQEAIRRMGPQTVAHLVIILFIIVGNIAYLVGGRERSRLGVRR